MNRRITFWGYFLVIIVLFLLVPQSFPDISGHDYAGLLFGYQENPFFLMMFSTFDLFFDYVSLAIPQAEMFAIRPFFLTRQPSGGRLYTSYFRFILPYFVPFILSKMVVLLILSQPVAWLWIGSYTAVWLAWLLINLNRRIAFTNGFILLAFLVMRVIAHFWF